jgi:hypothetical protein
MNSKQNTHRGAATGWTITILVAALAIGGALYLRSAKMDSTEQLTANEISSLSKLPRTSKLVQQKQKSLETYNQEMPLDELLLFYRQHCKCEVTAEAFEELSKSIVKQVIPRLWQESQSVDSSSEFILHRQMLQAIMENFPHQTLANADVIVFPESSGLRIVVSEPATDFFRDTAWHWRWIGEYIESLSADQQARHKEIDTYAAEELSEFLSVLGVAVVELAAIELESESDRVDADSIRKVFDRIDNYQPVAIVPHQTDIAFSEETKRQVLASLPDPMFRNITKQVGIEFRHRPNPVNQKQRELLSLPLGIAGGGVSAGDFDRDGFVDLYFAGGGGGALYRNQLGNSFENVTTTAGLVIEGETRAGYFVDFDNDGDQDLFVTLVNQPNQLFENDGRGSFTDVTQRVGLESGNEITHEAVWFDMDNDGLLDLYIANFGDWYNGAVPTIGRRNSNAPPNRLYKQSIVDGQIKFTEIGQQMKVDDRGWTHCVGAYDFDRDGWTDLFSLNDFGASLVYRNLEGQAFEEVSRQLKLDDIYNGMAFTLMDLNHSGDLSIYVSQIMKLTHRQRYRRPTENTKMQFDPKKQGNIRMLVNNRLLTRAFDKRYRDDHDLLIEPAKLGWAWDVSAMDYENDSDLDMIALNGTESDIPIAEGAGKKHDPNRFYLSIFDFEQNVCFVQKDGYFYDVSAISPIAFYGNSRGSAFLDFDGDGDLDVAVSNYNDKPRFFENLQSSGNNWIRLRLEGRGKSNRNAIGATVEIKFDGKSRFDQVVSGSGFLSQNPYELHFGLGDATVVDEVRIKWPSRNEQTLTGLAVNKGHQVTEPEDNVAN